jgi:hypothetical protein
MDLHESERMLVEDLNGVILLILFWIGVMFFLSLF